MDYLNYLLLGVGFGFIHAMEPDHLIGVATIVSTSRNKWLAFNRGAIWGLGHTLAILVFYLFIKIFGSSVEKVLFVNLEGFVGFMLIALGLRICYKLLKGKNHFHFHIHDGGNKHSHFHSHKLDNIHEHVHLPFGIGIVHGLAGSGAIILALTLEAPYRILGVFYIVLFGLGSCLAMGLLSGILVGTIDKIGKWMHKFEWVAIASSTIIAAASCILGYGILKKSGIF